MATISTERHVYSLATFFPEEEDFKKRSDWVLLILNRPIVNISHLRRLMRTCAYRVCADGGANALHGALSRRDERGLEEPATDAELPDLVHGDLDSIDGKVARYYESCGVDVTQDDDQYSTDFGKAMSKIMEYTLYGSREALAGSVQVNGVWSTTIRDEIHAASSILILGSVSGRLDQSIGLLSEMVNQQSQNPGVQLYLVGESGLSFFLRPGENVIEFAQIPKYARGQFAEGLFTRNAGILPLAGRAVISTQGFQYDVMDWETQMGGQISTSNYLEHNTVHVWTDWPVLFTVQMRDYKAEND